MAGANARLLHRGPDSAGSYADQYAALAMRRLAVIDLAGGEQPQANTSHSVFVMQNGEIYNFRELRRELENCGYEFRTNSDTEILAHGYDAWGEGVIERLNGMFAAVIWDTEAKKLILARDPLGQKPLYWHHSEHGLCWASELTALEAFPWVRSVIDPLALHHYLALQFVPDPLSIVAGISELRAGHKLIYEHGRSPQIHRWWAPRFLPKLQIDGAAAQVEAAQVLEGAVDRCLLADVPVGVFLSGGIDSGIVVAIAAKRKGSDLKTFTIDFDVGGYSEAAAARAVARHLGTQHYEFKFGAQSLRSSLEAAVAFLDEPLADPAMLPLFELARQARREVVVALTGDGGDETMAGYQRYYLDRLLQCLQWLPGPLKKHLLPRLTGILPDFTALPEERNPVLALKRLAQALSFGRDASLLRWGSYFTNEAALMLYRPELREALAPHSSEDLFREAVAYCFDPRLGGPAGGVQAASALDRTISADLSLYLAGDLLPKSDRMCMAVSLEARAPFLDREWVEWSLRLPEELKLRGLTGKWLLRETFGGQLPGAAGTAPKRGFAVPVAHWLRSELSGWLREMLLENAELETWFERPALEELIDRHCRRRQNHGKRLWALAVFSAWLQNRRK